MGPRPPARHPHQKEKIEDLQKLDLRCKLSAPDSLTRRIYMAQPVAGYGYFSQYGQHSLHNSLSALKIWIEGKQWEPIGVEIHQSTDIDERGQLLDSLSSEDFAALLLGIRSESFQYSYELFNAVLFRKEKVAQLTQDQCDQMTLTKDELPLSSTARPEEVMERIGFFLDQHVSKISSKRLEALLAMPEVKANFWMDNLLKGEKIAREQRAAQQ